jgi:hypothetical protein
MRKHILLLSIAILQLSLISNLKSEDKASKEQQKEEDAQTKETIKSVFGVPELVDIPLPKGFVMLKESYVHKAASFRFGEIYLEGDLVIDHTQTFYVKQMVLAGWAKGELKKTDKTIFKFTKYQLAFEKGRERCVIQIGKNETSDKTAILVDLKPILK